MRPITVICTSTGSSNSVGMVKSLKNVKERKIRIIGTDVNTDCVSRFFFDGFYQVPPGSATNYLEELLKIAKGENADVIVPGSNEEVLAISKNKKMFEDVDIKVSCNDHESFVIADDKGSMLSFLKEHNIDHAEFFLPQNMEELEECIYKLGYPQNNVIIKPRVGRGSRGVIRVVENLKDVNILNKRASDMLIADMQTLKRMLTDEDIKKIVVMEYLPGEEYSVDILSKGGKPLIIVPKTRIETIPGMSTKGEVIKNAEIEDIVTKICRALNLEYNINMQFKKSRDGRILIYEINPRIAASIVSCAAAGANLLYFGIKLALGEEIPKVKIKYGTVMMRYWEELFCRNGKKL